MKACKSCGTLNYDQAIFCENCGKDLGNPDMQAKDNMIIHTSPNEWDVFDHCKSPLYQDAIRIRDSIKQLHNRALVIKEKAERESEELSEMLKTAHDSYSRELAEIQKDEQEANNHYDLGLRSIRKTFDDQQAALQGRLARLPAIKYEYEQVVLNDKKYISWLKSLLDELPPKIVSRYANGTGNTPAKPDLDAIRVFFDKTMDESPDAARKRSQQIQGYYGRGKMQIDLAIKIIEAINYLQLEIPQVSYDCTLVIEQEKKTVQQEQENITRNKNTALLKLESEKRNREQNNNLRKEREKEKFEARLRQISELEKSNKQRYISEATREAQIRSNFFASALVSQYSTRVEKEIRFSGFIDSDWKDSPITPNMKFGLGWLYVPVLTDSKSLTAALFKTMGSYYYQSSIKVPALYHADHNARLYICYDEKKKTEAARLVQRFILEKFRINESGRMRILFFDPNGRGTNLGLLTNTESKNEEIGLVTLNDRKQIREALNQIVSNIDSLNGKVGSYNSIYDYNLNESDSIQETTLVLFDLEACIDRGSLSLLEIIWNQSKRYGINIILVSKYTYYNIQSCFPNERMNFNFILKSRPVEITLANAESLIECDAVGNCQFLPSGANTVQEDFLEDYRNRIEESLSIKNDFNLFFNAEKQYPYLDASSGIRLPILIKNTPGGRISEVILGTAASAHTLVTGTTGSGKSTFLHMLISSIIMNYHPDDVELWLLDYGRVEFVDYLDNITPHVRLISLEKNEEFTFSFLDFLKNFFTEREKEFQSKKCLSIQEYRKAYGKLSMPRVVIIVDEFHVMTQHIQHEITYRNILENALTEYRKFGLSFIFSNQTISGLVGLTETAKLQIRNRIALANDLREIKETLAVQSDNYSPALEKAMERTGIGELWFKEWTSQSDFHIENYKSLKIEKEERKKVLTTSITRDDKVKIDKMRYVLDGSMRIEYPASKVAEYLFVMRNRLGQRGLNFCIGTPTTIEKYFILKIAEKYNNNILIAGQDSEMAMDIILSLCYSGLCNRNMEIVIIADPSDELLLRFNQYQRGNAALKDITVISNYNDICNWVSDLHSSISEKKQFDCKKLVFWFGYRDIYEELSMYPPKPADNPSEAKNKTITIDSDTINDPQLEKMAKEMNLSVSEVLSFLSMPKKEVSRKNTSCYNANSQIIDIFAKGGKLGIFSVVPIEYYQSIERIREFDQRFFLHKIAMAMSRSESVDWGLKDRASNLPEHIEALYFDGLKTQQFRPFTHQKGG